MLDWFYQYIPQYLFYVYISDNLSLFLPTICSNQDLVQKLVERNPEEFSYLAQTLAFLTLPEDLNIEAINLTQLCFNENVIGNQEKEPAVNGPG